MVEYIGEHLELNINMCYNVNVPENLLEMQVKDDIYVYVSNTRTIQKQPKLSFMRLRIISMIWVVINGLNVFVEYKNLYIEIMWKSCVTGIA